MVEYSNKKQALTEKTTNIYDREQNNLIHVLIAQNKRVLQ
jgi:hypothetical protein